MPHLYCRQLVEHCTRQYKSRETDVAPKAANLTNKESQGRRDEKDIGLFAADKKETVNVAPDMEGYRTAGTALLQNTLTCVGLPHPCSSNARDVYNSCSLSIKPWRRRAFFRMTKLLSSEEDFLSYSLEYSSIANLKGTLHSLIFLSIQ